MGVNGVGVGPFGLIFNQNEAMGSMNVFRPLQGPKTAIFDLKTTKNTIWGKLGFFGGLLQALKGTPVWDPLLFGVLRWSHLFHARDQAWKPKC